MNKLVSPFIDLLFPMVCACCGSSVHQKNSHLCPWCREQRFDKPDPEQLQLLPESVQMQFAMWSFDKGGYLQDLLHKLKYDFLRSVGEELGRTLADAYLNQMDSEQERLFEQYEPIIVPVPLHRSKLRKRGYNQARTIGEGFAKVTQWEVIEPDGVQRVRKTKTQTGLSAEKRTGNLRNAFRVKNPSAVKDRIPVLIDDVFTTGATTFELAGVLIPYSKPSVIVTVAKA